MCSWQSLLKRHVGPVCDFLRRKPKRPVEDAFPQIHTSKGRLRSSAAEKLFSMARQKLLFTTKPDEPLNARHAGEHAYSGRVAVFASRLCPALDLARTRVRDITNTWVEFHMATVKSIPRHQNFIFCDWPSEPFLHEAAARQLHIWKTEGNAHPAFTILYESFKGDLLDVGELGELVARVFLTVAHDNAIEKLWRTSLPADRSPRKTPHFSTSISIEAFFQSLLTEVALATFLSSLPLEGGRESMATAFKESVINFTHFARWGPHTPLDRMGLLFCFLRHAAIICKVNQEGVDIVIPVLIRKDGDIGVDNMTAILIQVKRVVGRSSKKAMAGIDMDLFGGPDKTKDDKKEAKDQKKVVDPMPYIAVVMDLAVEPRKGLYSVVRDENNVLDKDTRSDMPYRKYGITLSGVNGDLYPFIDNTTKNQLLTLLSTEKLYSSHEYQEPENLNGVAALLPYLERDVLSQPYMSVKEELVERRPEFRASKAKSDGK